jgi:hypothetical protein
MIEALYQSSGKIVFQSSFMLTIVQPRSGPTFVELSNVGITVSGIFPLGIVVMADKAEAEPVT